MTHGAADQLRNERISICTEEDELELSKEPVARRPLPGQPARPSKCFARLLLLLPCSVISIKLRVHFPLTLAVRAEPNRDLDVHLAVDAPALFLCSFVV